MSQIRFVCPTCRASLTPAAGVAGGEVRCLRCDAVAVPAPKRKALAAALGALAALALVGAAVCGGLVMAGVIVRPGRDTPPALERDDTGKDGAAAKEKADPPDEKLLAAIAEARKFGEVKQKGDAFEVRPGPYAGDEAVAAFLKLPRLET